MLSTGETGATPSRRRLGRTEHQAYRASSQHRHFQHEIQLAESLFEETYGHTHDVEVVSLDLTTQLPDIELLSSTFRKRLLALEGLDAELTESGAATAGLLVHVPSGGVFRRSSTGARVYVSHDRPEPSGGVSKDPLLDTIRLMKDFATGDETIKGLTVPSWLRVQGFPAQLDAQIDASMVEQSPVLTRLVEDLRLRPAETHTAKYWLDQRACSLAGQLAARSRASSSSSLPKKIIYLGVGIDDDQVKMLYIGKTIRGYTRIAEHVRATVAWTIAGADAAPLHYQTAAACDQVVYFPLVESLSGDPAAIATTLAIWEWLLCWLLGTYQLNADLLGARASHGLPSLAGVLGVNGTACLEGPGQRRASLGVDDQIGPTDPLRGDLSHALAASGARLLGQRVLQEQGHPADIGAAREGIHYIRSLLSGRTKALALAGELEYRWRLGRDARVKCLGYELKTEDKVQLQAMMLKGKCEGLFRVRVRLEAPLPQSDLFVGCTEEQRPLYQGIVMEIGAAEADDFPHKGQIMHAPFSPVAQSLADQVFGMLPDQQQVRRREAARAKQVEIAARRSTEHHQLSSTAQKLQVGVALLNQFVCLVLEGEGRLFKWLADSRNVAAVAEMSSALGFGVRAWGDHNYPQTIARLVTGGVGLYDFSHGTASRIPHLAQEEAFELRLLAFNNSWVRCPRRLTPVAYQTLEAQRRNDASFTAFLNAGREILGPPPRQVNYLPPGFEASGGFSYKVSGKRDKHGLFNFNRCGGLNLIGGGTYFEFCEADLEDVLLEAPLVWRSNIMACSREEDLEFDFKPDGVEDASWYTHVWTDFRQKGFVKRARCWAVMSSLKKKFEAEGQGSGAGESD